MRARATRNDRNDPNALPSHTSLTAAAPPLLLEDDNHAQLAAHAEIEGKGDEHEQH